MLCNARQAVISHFCPVEPKIALIFAAVLCSRLIATPGFFDAFESTLETLLSNKERVLVALDADDKLRDLAARARLWNLSMSSVIEVGTPVFCE
jgi:hypothetical protein